MAARDEIDDRELYRLAAEFLNTQPKPGVAELAAFLGQRANGGIAKLVVGQFIVAALFESREIDLVFWSLVAAEVSGTKIETIGPAIGQEICGYLKCCGARPNPPN